MTDNEKLAIWQGIEPRGFKRYPDYPNNDPAAMSLLVTLAEKGFSYLLLYDNDGYALAIDKDDMEIVKIPDGVLLKTRRAAVCAAVLELIRKR